MVDKIVAHSKTVLSIARRYGWLIGARYTNLRDISSFKRAHFIDIDWKNYNYEKHLQAVKVFKPKYTVARDWERPGDLNLILKQAENLSEHAERVIIVPKVESLKAKMLDLIPEKFILGFSVPTRYGGTTIDPMYFDGRMVHLLGGRPEKQRELAKQLNVISIDCNRFTLDARYGDFFDGKKFTPHPKGGYERCIQDSLKNINVIWRDYGRQKRISSKNV